MRFQPKEFTKKKLACYSKTDAMHRKKTVWPCRPAREVSLDVNLSGRRFKRRRKGKEERREEGTARDRSHSGNRVPRYGSVSKISATQTSRLQVIDPLVVVSDGNGRATDRPVHTSGASFGPSPAIISTVTYAHVVHVFAIYRLPVSPARIAGESRGKYASFTRKAVRARARCIVRALATGCVRNSVRSRRVSYARRRSPSDFFVFFLRI